MTRLLVFILERGKVCRMQLYLYMFLLQIVLRFITDRLTSENLNASKLDSVQNDTDKERFLTFQYTVPILKIYDMQKKSRKLKGTVWPD